MKGTSDVATGSIIAVIQICGQINKKGLINMKNTNQYKVNFLTLQETRLRLIEDTFNKSVCLLASKARKSETECPPEQPREWPGLPDPRSIKQPLTQEQMRRACESIQYNMVSDVDAIPKHNYTVIDFEKGCQTWNEQIFTLNSMVLGIKVSGGGVTVNYDFARDNRLYAVVYVRSEGQAAQAFLKAKGADGKELFFELAEFYMLYHTCDNEDIEEKNGDANATQESDAPVIENDKVTGEIGIFTLFNRKQNLLFITTY